MKIREINPEQKAAQVLEAARSLFVEKGYHNVSIPLIVERSGVSTGAIYHYFGNKEGLAKSVHDQTLQSFQRMLSDCMATCDSTKEKLYSFASLVFAVAEDDPVLMEYMLLMKHDEFLADIQPICAAEPFQLVQQIIHSGIRENELRSNNAFLAAVAFTGVLTRAVELRLKGVIKKNLSEILDDLFDLAWASISHGN